MSGDGYLQPRPADYDLNPRLKPQNGQSRPNRHQGDGHMEPKGRFDSGVADLEMHRMSNSPRPKSSAMYEYIDSGSHYEDVPGTLGRSVSGLPNGGHDVRQSTVSDSRSVVTDVTSDTDDTATIFKTPVDKKRRYNPLYEPNTSAQGAFARNKTQQHLDSLERHIRVQCAFLCIISLAAIAALALSLYLVFFQVLDKNNSMMEKIKQMEKTTSRLSEENEQLKLIVTAAGFNTSLLESPLIKTLSNTSEAVLTFEEQLSSLSNQVTFNHQNLSQRISDLTASFDGQLLNISKMPGPQGPPGVGNLSACAYANFSSTTVASPGSSATQYRPSLEELQKKVVMFAGCAVEGGTSYTLQTNVISPSAVQYRCMCSGQVLNHNDRTCRIHIVLCPRETGYDVGTT